MTRKPSGILFALPSTALCSSICLAVVVAAAPALAGAADFELPRAFEEPGALADARLDVGIRIFDPGTEGVGENRRRRHRIFDNVRESEARYIAVHLMKRLEASDLWGEIRVLPRDVNGLGLMVAGRILRSDGRRLRLEIEVTDASGRRWLERRYDARADALAYEVEGGDPFEFLYSRIAEDLRLALRSLQPGQIEALEELARLRFAADLAPETFASFVQVDEEGHLYAAPPPDADEAITVRVTEIRERALGYLDGLTRRYIEFYDIVRYPYFTFRAASFRERDALHLLALEESRQLRECRGYGLGMVLRGPCWYHGARRGRSPYIDWHNAEIVTHESALDDLTTTFDGEVEPIVVEVESETRRLLGSAETRLEEWRRALSDTSLQ